MEKARWEKSPKIVAVGGGHGLSAMLRGLKNHTPYYYRVCAVNTSGQAGPMSREFSAYTREDR